MADTNSLSQFLTDVANSIRSKTGGTEEILASDFDTEIESISTTNNQDKTITPSTEEQIITADEGYTGIGTATVSAVDSSIDENITAENIVSGVSILGVDGTAEMLVGEEVSITPSTSEQEITPSDTYNGITKATVSAVDSSIDSDIVASNIKKGVDILGVTGTVSISDFESYTLACNTALEILDGSYTPVDPGDNHIYGVKRSLTTSSTEWTRTDDSIDFTATATIAGSDYYSDFDNCYPWSAMTSYLFDVSTNTVLAEYGDDEFTFTPSDSNVQVMTRIPKMWIQRYQDDEYEYIRIANYAADGFTEYEERSVGRYLSSSTSTPNSISGVTCATGAYAASFRTNIRAVLGSKFGVFDVWTLNIIRCLYLVEFADNNTQNILGVGGRTDGTISSGTCDELGIKSGCKVSDIVNTILYRGIEGLYGVMAVHIIDGINYVDGVLYVCDDYNNYAYETTTNYNELGIPYLTSTGYIATMGYDENYPIIMMPTKVAGSSTTYYCDTHGNAATLGLITYRRNRFGFY